MDRAELRTEVMTRADDDKGAVARPNEVNRWLNLAVRTVWRAWPWTFATQRDDVDTTADDPLVLLPVGVQRPKRVYIASTDRIVLPHVERVLQLTYPDVTETDEPWYYCDGGLLQDSMEDEPRRQMRLYPTPDAVYTLEVTSLRTAPSMTSDVHISPLPEEFDEALILWCLVNYYRKLEDLPQSNEHRIAYKEEVDSLIDTFSSWQVDRYPQLIDDSGF